MPKQQQSFDQYCIVELFGRQVIAGRVTEQTIGSCAFIRVDVPAYDDSPPVTHFYGQGAIYGMTPVSEDAVLAVLRQYQPRPVNVYIPSLQLPSPGSERLDIEDDMELDDDNY
jgi:hypothetical protein